MIFPTLKSSARISLRVGVAMTMFALLVPHLTNATEAEPSGDDMLKAIQLLEASTSALSVDPATRSKSLDTAYEELLSKHPNHISARVSYGGFLALEGREKEALSEWQLALELDPKNGDAAYLIGNHYLEKKDIHPAVTHLLLATSNSPKQPVFHYDLATILFLFRHEVYALAKVADSTECMHLALEHYRLARDLAPMELTYAKAYAETFYTLTPPDWQAAINAWKHVFEMSADKDDARIHLARVHMKLGNDDDATRLLSEITTQRLIGLRDKLQAKIDTKPER